MKVIKKADLIMTEIIKIFEYEKNNDRYKDGIKLYQRMIIKTLSIAKTLYLGYLFGFLFDNITSYFVYAKDILQIVNINKNLWNKQTYLYNSWYRENNVDKLHPINI